MYEQFTKVIIYMNKDFVLSVFDAVVSKTIPITQFRHFHCSRSSFVASDVICPTTTPDLFVECEVVELQEPLSLQLQTRV